MYEPEGRSGARGREGSRTPSRSAIAWGVLAVLLVGGIVLASPYRVQYSTGESMEPTLGSGSIVVYSLDEDPEVGDVAVVEAPEHQRIVHRVVETRESGPVLRGDNNQQNDRFAWGSDPATAPPERTHAVVAVLHDGHGPIVPSIGIDAILLGIAVVVGILALGILALDAIVSLRSPPGARRGDA